jgi:hypothetical protein
VVERAFGEQVAGREIRLRRAGGGSSARAAGRKALRAGPACALAALLAALPLVGARAILAGERGTAPSSREEKLNADRRAAIQKGCQWLARQQRENGAIGDNKGLVAITALSALALMSEGSGYDRGVYGEQVKRAVDYLLMLGERPAGSGFPPGYLAETSSTDGTSRMHGHGYAMLTLASALGTADEKQAPRMRAVLRKAVAVAESSQTQTGGWGYNPSSTMDHEGSVTVTIAQGLRAARDAGIKVSQKVVDNGLHYLVRSQRNTGDDDDGSFKYSLSQERSTYALTAAALSSFYLFGEYGSDPVRRGRLTRAITYIKKKVPSVAHRREWFYYGNFYAAWASWQKDGNDPEPALGARWTADASRSDALGSDQFWGPWHAKMYPVILQQQKSDGKWTDSNDDHFLLGEVLPTAFAVLTLAIPDECVPIFQR